MNFKSFYNKAQNRLKDSVLSLWATGDAEMQHYFEAILNKEGLMAEPVFQTAFPWEPSNLTFSDTNGIFSDAFINALAGVKNEDYRFPKDRNPYKHQVESWDALINRGKSIAVTTGTGSGKTECFMLPVLYDLYTHCRPGNGINALFLYPLNALIGSQKKRMDAWCRALNGLNYAVYNGNTPDDSKNEDKIGKLPELITRKQIRATPPQILFTNPSMLEYILVRNRDVDLLKNSAGSLRWILLDEAHTLTGSSAAEMALLIRRVVDAFQVDINHLRFAITSATVGGGEQNEKQLRTFMSNLCGIPEENIQVITGGRVLSPELTADQPENTKEVNKLRKDILSEPALTLSHIGAPFGAKNIDERLTLVDELSDCKVDEKSIFPVRGHFFARGISGVFVCTNPECKEHNDIRPSSALGTMTTIAGNLCKCGSPLLELVACRSCGNQLLEGEIVHDTKTGDQTIRMVSAVTQDPFAIESDDDDDDATPVTGDKFYFTRNFDHGRYTNAIAHFSITPTGNILRGEARFVEADNGNSCPHCGETTANPMHFRLSSSFINRILADIFLEETPEAIMQTKEMLWKGHKYISFTDSRQGTAKISALINQDNEGNWVRSQVYHKLSERQQEWRSNQEDISATDLVAMIEQLEGELETTQFPILRKSKEQAIETYRAKLNDREPDGKPTSLDWKTLIDYLINLSDFTTLFKGNNPHDSTLNREHYLKAILYDQFARRLPRERSLENLGMVNMVYPKLQDLKPPSIADTFGISRGDWNNLLKIGADFVIRNYFFFFVDTRIYPYSTSFLRSQIIFDTDTPLVGVKKWPKFERKIQQNRLALLICAGLGMHELDDIDTETEDRINELMEQLWRTIRFNILDRDGDGYKLNLEQATQFQLASKLWLCPVKRRLIDTQFKGYSPWIKGNLTRENISHYQITKSIQFPEFPYPFNFNKEKNIVDLERTRQWISTNRTNLKQEGVWNNLHEQIILHRPLYLSGEHSAQQNEHRLKELEDQFEQSQINILNCSTTMEMGVDIGGISAVIMNNVPPSPANYLQRAGRAGRRSEARSMAFTICSPNPIGLNAMDNPMWALSHPIAPPFLSFNSQIVVDRHINAFFLGKFVQTDHVKGLNVKMTNDSFFFNQEFPLAEMFNCWLSGNESHQFKQSLQNIVRKTPLADKSFPFLLHKVIEHFQQLTQKTFNKNTGFEDKLSVLSTEFGEDSPAFRAVIFQKKQFLDKQVIGYLVEEGFLPGAGLPTGIVEFDTVNIDDLTKQRKISKPSYFITRALSEFAPGKQIVIDGKSFISAGILFKNERGIEAEREVIQSCSHCGYQRIIAVSSTEDIHSRCPHCEHPAFVGINFKNPRFRGTFTEMIQPAGFAVDIYEAPRRKISEASSVQYVDPLLINVKPWIPQQTTAALYDIRESGDNAEILFYNLGKGDGYAVCLHCGRIGDERSELDDHKRLRGGKNNDNDRNKICSGNSATHAIHEHIILGGRFKTDFCELRFRDDTNNFSHDPALLYTLGAILSKELAHYLAVEEGEISFGLKHYDQYSTVFLFDTAKGGAGYSSQFFLYADEIFRIAKNKLTSCFCEIACTKCLIDRATQWHMDRLDRNKALAWLDRVVNIKVPKELSTIYPNLKIVISGVRDEIAKLNYANKIKEIWLFGASNFLDWDLEQLASITNLKNKVKINFVFDQRKTTLTIQEKISLIQLSAWADIMEQPTNSTESLKTVCKVLTDEGLTAYLATDFERVFKGNWGNSDTGIIYKNPDASSEHFHKMKLTIDKQSIIEATIEEKAPLRSDGIAELLLDGLKGKIDLKDIMHNQSFEVTYVDRYLKTPLGCLLMIQFIGKLSQILQFSIHGITFKGKDFDEERSPRLLFHNFKNGNDRNSAVTKFAEQAGLPNPIAVNGQIPHYRYFEFKNQHHKIIIRPDAGIEHGWFLGVDKYKPFNINSVHVSDAVEIIKQDNNSLLYTISIE